MLYQTFISFWLTPDEYNRSDFCRGAIGIGCPSRPPTKALPGGTKVSIYEPITEEILNKDIQNFKTRMMNGQIIYALIGTVSDYPYRHPNDILYKDKDKQFYPKMSAEKVNKLIKRKYWKYQIKLKKQNFNLKTELQKPFRFIVRYFKNIKRHISKR